MRLVYLDEAGTSAKATWLCVAGVIVHGDGQWREADRRIVELIEKYIPEEDRLGFVFHATDVFHGGRYFDRRNPRWASREQRWPILVDLAQIISDLALPVVVGTENRLPFSFESPRPTDGLHTWSAVNCLFWTDLWLTAFAPDEMATVVHEDGAEAKPMIKEFVRMLRYPELWDWGDFDPVEAYGLPFDHILDTVHFTEKADARLLQLADLCAFIIGRSIQSRSVCQPVVDVIRAQTAWCQELLPNPRRFDEDEAWP